MFVFDGVLRYASSGHGDVISLHGPLHGHLRLRVGDYRVFFSPIGDRLRIHAVKNRREAYRG